MNNNTNIYEYEQQYKKFRPAVAFLWMLLAILFDSVGRWPYYYSFDQLNAGQHQVL